MNKKILIITERRADYSRFKEILKEINKKNLKYILVVTGIHLENDYGKTINEIKKDGFKITHEFKMFDNKYLKNDDVAGMSRALSRCFKKITEIIKLKSRFYFIWI